MTGFLSRVENEVSVANLALAYLKEGPLVSLDENRPAARHVAAQFGSVRDALLRSHPWNFARDVATLAQDPTARAGRFSRVYPLPATCLRVLEVEGLDEDSWTVETRGGLSDDTAPLVPVLCTEATTPKVFFVRTVAEPALWDALFVQVFALELAAVIAPLLGQADAADDLEARAMRRMNRATRINSREAARSEVTRSPSFVTARW
jgi:hypothetical protein